MRKEQIESLRALAVDLRERNLNLRHAAGIEELTHGEPTPADSLLRLLEERKRLLAALKREHEGDTGLSQESLADLAFAEADTEDAAEPQEKQF